MYPASFEAWRLLECLDIITSIMCLHKRTFQYLFSLAPVLFVPSHMHMDTNVCFQILFHYWKLFYVFLMHVSFSDKRKKCVIYASALYTLTSFVTGLVALCTFHNRIYSFIGSFWQHTIDYFISTILKRLVMLEKLPLAYNKIIVLSQINILHAFYLFVNQPCNKRGNILPAGHYYRINPFRITFCQRPDYSWFKLW